MILLCPTPKPHDPRRNLAVAPPPSAEQLLAGKSTNSYYGVSRILCTSACLLELLWSAVVRRNQYQRSSYHGIDLLIGTAGLMSFQLMQELDVDLGEMDEVDGSSIDIRDGTLTTRMIVQHVVGCLAEGDAGWLRLWTDAFEQQHEQLLGSPSSVPAASGGSVMLSALGSMSMVCNNNANEAESKLQELADSVVAQYDRHRRQFVVAQQRAVAECPRRVGPAL